MLRNEMIRQVRADADVTVSDVDFVSDQKPSDDFDDDFVADFAAKVTIQGKALVRLIGAQARTLERRLETLKPDTAIRLLDDAAPTEVLVGIRQQANRVMNRDAFDRFGHGAVIKEVAFTEDKQFWEAAIDPGAGKITFSVEVGSYGKWKR